MSGVKKLIESLNGNGQLGVIQEQYNSIVRIIEKVDTTAIRELAPLLKALRKLGEQYGKDIG